MAERHALHKLRVMKDNINSLCTMAFAFEECCKFLKGGNLKHNAKILSGLAVSTRVMVEKNGDEILKHLTKGGK